MYREMEAGVDGEFGLAHMTGLCMTAWLSQGDN